MATLTDRLRLSFVTAQNDDVSEPLSDKRDRHVARQEAIQDAIEALVINSEGNMIKIDLKELDEVIAAFGRARTETMMPPELRLGAEQRVRDFLFALRKQVSP